MPISDALKRIYAVAPRDDHYVECLSISHPNLAFPTRHITNELGGVTVTLEDGGGQQTFDYLPFAVLPPRAAEEANLQLQVAIDNVSRDLIDELEAASGDPTIPLEITYRIYLASDLAVLQNDPATQARYTLCHGDQHHGQLHCRYYQPAHKAIPQRAVYY